MTDLFKEADKKAEKPKKSKKAEKPSLTPTANITALAVLSSLISKLDGVKKRLDAEVKEEGFLYFLLQKATNSYDMVTARAKVGVELRKNKNTSPISEKNVELLEELGIERKLLDPHVNKVEARYYFNPDILNDQVVLEKISNALSRIPELKGEDIILYQEAKEINTLVSSDRAIEKAFSLDGDKAAQALKVLTTIATRPSIIEKEDEDGNKIESSPLSLMLEVIDIFEEDDKLVEML